MKSNKLFQDYLRIILKIASIIMCFIFPIILWIFLTEDTSIEVFSYTWIAFYSCIFACLIHKSVVLKILLGLLNFFSVAFLILLFLMSDANLIWKVLLKTLIPVISFK